MGNKLKAKVTVRGVRPLLWCHFGDDAIPLEPGEKTGQSHCPHCGTLYCAEPKSHGTYGKTCGNAHRSSHSAGRRSKNEAMRRG
jgi:hypothetical protein